MPQSPEHRVPAQRSSDPNLTVLPAISAPVDEGLFIPRRPRGVLERLLWVFALCALAAAVLAFAFLHATPMG